MKTRTALVGLAAVLGLLAAACSSADSGESTSLTTAVISSEADSDTTTASSEAGPGATFPTTTVPDAAPPTTAVSAPEEPPATVTEPPIPLPLGANPALAGRAALAVEDLAERLGVAVSEISVLRAEIVVWPDGAIGCPEPGMEYIQVTVEGYLIELEAGGMTFTYHGGGRRPDPFLCLNPVSPLPPGSGGGGDT